MSGKISLSTLGYKDNSFKQEQSFVYSLQKGVRWIDAPFWSCNGEGLEVVSQYLKRLSEYPKLKNDVKVIAKGGFATGKSLHHFSDLEGGVGNAQMLGIDSVFSLNKTFIQSQLEYSLQRLKSVGCHTFLIYIPDIFSQYQGNESRFSEDLATVFEVLELAVQQGDLVQYGISGSIPALTKAFSGSVAQSLRIQTKRFSNFNVIQVPFNCSEMQLMFPLELYSNALSLFKSCHLDVWVNRPITARVPKGYLKMKEYPVSTMVTEDDVKSLLSELSSIELELKEWVISQLDERQFERDFNITSDFDLSLLLEEYYSRITSYSHWESWWSDVVGPHVERVIYTLSKSASSKRLPRVKVYSEFISNFKESFGSYYKGRSNEQLHKYREVLNYLFSDPEGSLHDIWLSYLLSNSDISLISIGLDTKEHMDMLLMLQKEGRQFLPIPQVSWDNVKSYVEAKKLVVIE